MSERISTLFVAMNDENGGPTAYILSDKFPFTKKLTLSCLLLDFKIATNYSLNLKVITSENKTPLIDDIIPFSLANDDSNKLISNNSDRMSTLINLNTTPINFPEKNVEYEISVSLISSNIKLQETKTYIRTKLEND